jgi:hypothetical protein
MSATFTGQCLCGAVHYEYSAETIFAGNCHCRDCQRSSGSGSSPILFIPIDAINIKGDVKYFESKGRSGQSVTRGFCPTCGSQLFGKPAASPTLIGIKVGTLDDPTVYEPSVDIFTESNYDWHPMNPDLAKFPQMPPA